MFKLTRYILTIVATFGLAANLQACKDCQRFLYAKGSEGKEFFDYARKNADVLLQEYTNMVNDSKTVEGLRQRVLDIIDKGYNVISPITKTPNKSANELFADKEFLKTVEILFEKASDSYGWMNTIFPPTIAPQLNAHAILMIARGDKEFKDLVQQARKDLEKPELKDQFLFAASSVLTSLRPRLVQIEQERTTITTIIDFFFDSIAANKALLLQLGKNFNALLKDDAFFAEIENNTPGHTFPKTATTKKLQETAQLLATSFNRVGKLIQEQMKKHMQKNQGSRSRR